MKISRLENYVIGPSPLVCSAFIYFQCSERRSTYILESGSISADEIFIISSEDVAEDISLVFRRLSSFLDNIEEGGVISLDISCMPRRVMAELLVTISLLDRRKIDVAVFYVVAGFTEPTLLTSINEAIEPIHQRFSGWSTPETKPTSLVLGLGYEPHKAAGASEYFEPSDQWVFLPLSPITEFGVRVKENNSSILADTRRDRLVEYDVTDPELTYGQLEMVIGILLQRSNPVLLPFGPKIFFFLCLVHCFGHSELGVWDFTTRNEAIEAEVCASDVVVAMLCEFCTS